MPAALLPRSDLELSRLLAAEAARHIAWLIDAAHVTDGWLTVDGWALLTKGTATEARLTVNGVPFEVVDWRDSIDVERHFFGILNSRRARFSCQIDINDVPRDDYFRFELEQAGDGVMGRRTAWWLRVAPGGVDASGDRRARVIGTADRLQFEIGGATLFHRIQDYMQRRFEVRYEDLTAILDWGCGAGRLMTHFCEVRGPSLWGSDIDADNLKFCREHLAFAHFELFPLRPPTRFVAAMFDFIVGISVCSHLAEHDQQLWLAELRRMSKPGGFVLLSVQGYAQSAMYLVPPADVREVHRLGFVVKGVNPSINDSIDERTYYKDVVQTHDHIREHWGKHFEIVEVVDGLAANQDLVVMRAS